IPGVVQTLLLYGQSHAVDTETQRDIGEVKPEQIVMIREQIGRAGRNDKVAVCNRTFWTMAGPVRTDRLPRGEGTCLLTEDGVHLNQTRVGKAERRAAKRRGVLAMRAAAGSSLYILPSPRRRAA